MTWKDLLQSGSTQLTAPWLGGRKVYHGSRTWRLVGDLPHDHGWYLFAGTGRTIEVVGAAQPDPGYSPSYPRLSGYLVGNRLIPLHQNKAIDLKKALYIHLVELGIDNFNLVEVLKDPAERLIYSQQMYPLGPENAVREAYLDRFDSLKHILGVSPELEYAFKFAVKQRNAVEERRLALEEQRRQEAMRTDLQTSVGRRNMATESPIQAISAALEQGDAEFVHIRQGTRNDETIVQYRVDGQRLECVINRRSFQVVDAGICLTDEWTGEKGDTYVTLESLPSVVRQAMRENKLVIYRHI